jgi:hypothetical protein
VSGELLRGPILPVVTENSVRSENTGVPIIREIMVATTMSSLFVAFFALIASTFRTRAALQTEILALRHQLAVFQKNAPRRLRLHRCDRLLWVVLYRCWSGWRRCLEMVRPDTVLRWHRRAFAWHWTRKSRRHPGRPEVTANIRDLIRRMSQANPLCTPHSRRTAQIVDCGGAIHSGQIFISASLLSRSKPVASTFASLERKCRFSLMYATKLLLIKPDSFTTRTPCTWMHSTTGRGRDCQSLDSDVLANRESASTRSAISVPQECGLMRTEFSVGRGTWEASQLTRPFAVRGKTVLLSVGWEAADATCWIT